MPELGFFFKEPWASDTHDAAAQARDLHAWAGRLGALVASRTGV